VVCPVNKTSTVKKNNDNDNDNDSDSDDSDNDNDNSNNNDNNNNINNNSRRIRRISYVKLPFEQKFGKTLMYSTSFARRKYFNSLRRKKSFTMKACAEFYRRQIAEKLHVSRVGHKHSPARPGGCLKCQASPNHSSLARLASAIFHSLEIIIKLQNERCFFFNSVFPINFSTQINHCPFLFCKVSYSKLFNNLALTQNIWLRKEVNNTSNSFLVVIIT